MLIVVVMISLVSLVAIPRFANANARRHMQSARLRIAAGLVTARQAAIQKGVPVLFQIKSNTVTVAAGADTLLRPVPLNELYKVSASFRVASGDLSVVFNGRGHAASGAPEVILLTRSGTPMDSVRISKTGMVQVQR
jgi:Tfp pilus assembly protein FimT